MKLDRSRPFGKVSPPMIIDGAHDRPACYEQDGKLFDAHDLCIVAGAVAPIEQSVVTPEPVRAPEPEVTLGVKELIATANAMPYQTWARHARAVLGESCPSGKKAILAALEAAQAAYDDKQAKRAAFSARAAEVEQSAMELPPASVPAPSPAASGVDLAAWGRGQKNYLFGEVQKAARQQHNVQLSERRAVVDFLIEAGIIRASEARKDV